MVNPNLGDGPRPQVLKHWPEGTPGQLTPRCPKDRSANSPSASTLASRVHELHPVAHGTEAAAELLVAFAKVLGLDDLLAGAATGVAHGE